ncbi:6724_t:CDS:2 [Ambispora leptoticha]|uniref:Large ribosomal subunit protein mL50 n=1 Tax=Ambispora leptoticha TaxID=144679 RepID=A0A9N9DRK6_9GLOM|nr:6724_t:CDS:2 [Ambispora leptoticha]
MKITTPRFLHSLPPISLTGFSTPPLQQRLQHLRPVVPIHHHIFVASFSQTVISQGKLSKFFKEIFSLNDPDPKPKINDSSSKNVYKTSSQKASPPPQPLPRQETKRALEDYEDEDLFEDNDMDEEKRKKNKKLNKIPKKLPAIPTKTPQEIHNIMFNIVMKHCQGRTNQDDWLQFRFDEEPSLKFKILKDCTAAISREIPNFELNKMRTVNDVIKFYLTEQEPDERLGHPVADWFERNKDRLPPNMHFVPYVKERNVPEKERMRPNKREF